MSVATGTKELNFANKREKSISATSERIEVPSNNGTTFDLGQTIDIRLPSGMARGNYLDFQNSYVKLSISATRDADSDNNATSLPRNGIYNLIEKVEIMSSSSTLSTIESYNKLCNIVMDMDSNASFKDYLGSVQYGTHASGTSSNKGQLLTPASGTGAKTTTFCFGLILTSLFSNQKYLPLFHSDNITIRLTLASYEDGLIGGNAASAAGAQIQINPVSMVCNVVKLDPMAQSLIDQANGGVYTMILDDYRNSRYGAVATADRNINANLGFSHQSLSRILFGFFLASTKLTDSQGSRVHRYVNEYTFQLNGKSYPAQKIKANFLAASKNASEAVAEIRASNRASGDFQNGGEVKLSEITDAANGRMFYEIDLEGLRCADDVYSGLYTIGGTTSLEVSMNANGTAISNLHVWGQFQGALKLDTNQNSTFTYSV